MQAHPAYLNGQIQHSAVSYSGGAHPRATMELILQPIDDEHWGVPVPMVQLVDRLNAVVQMAVQLWDTYPPVGGRQQYISVVFENAGYTSIVEHEFGTHRKFRSRQEILQRLPGALLQAYENLVQSDDDFFIEQLLILIRLDTVSQTQARGRLKSHIKKAIHSEATQGLYTYPHEDGQCGFKAVLVHLQRIYDEEVDEEFPFFKPGFGTSAMTLVNLTTKKRFNQLSIQLARSLHHQAPYEWQLMVLGQSTAQQFVDQHPKYQIIIFNEPTRQILEHRRGTEYVNADQEYGKKYSIVMSYCLGHMVLIRGLFQYLGKSFQTGNIFCYDCLRIQTRQAHRCTHELTCKRCLMRFNEQEAFDQHCRGWSKCGQCELIFYSTECLEYHRCSREGVEVCTECNRRITQQPHQCQSYKCVTCQQMVGALHQCEMQKPKEPKETRPEKEGEHYYAFDLESMITDTDQGRVHKVNLIVVRRCFIVDEYIFHSMEDFEEFLMSLTHPSTFFAHNLKGYDGRMVFDFLMDKCTPPQAMTWNGAKIMTMTYGKITFQDTLLHWPASLAQLPKMLGLDESEFKKGFFPHTFNRPEHQDYRGPIPPVHYFEPEMMSKKKKQEFYQWYQEQADVYYDFKKELVDYCVSDTRILAAAIEAYMIQQMQRFPINPFSCLTIASYAKRMYLTYFMPDESLYRLSRKQDERIRKSMHGGRTDTRRMLREWTPEEVAQGIYGKYQDVQSLYPTVQFYDPLPVGVPELKTWGPNDPVNEEELMGLFGFVCCDIECTQFLFHPIIVDMHENGRLVADLNPKKEIVIPTPELHLALKNGYRVTRLYYAYVFEQSTDLFRTYFQTFLKDKIEASGMPKWVQDHQDWLEFQAYHEDELGIYLKREDMVQNPSRKTGAKLLCNSLWGKFGERIHTHSWKICELGRDDAEMMALEKRWVDGDIDMTYRQPNRQQSHMAIAYKLNIDLEKRNTYFVKQHLGKVNIALASMVTSHARCRLWTELNKLGDRVLYHDTDSIIYEHHPNKYNIKEGRYLGEWECETGGLPIVQFASTGPKCYTYVVQQPNGTLKENTKVKGITLNAYNQQRINFNVMKQLVTDDLDKIETQCLLFKYDRQNGTMITRTILKEFKKVYEKGEIDPTTWKVYPFGHRQFPRD